MGLDADALAVAAGELHVIDAADALELANSARGRPVPLACHHVGDWCVVLFLIKQTDGWWREEVVCVEGGDVRGAGGGTGGIVELSSVRRGEPTIHGVGRHGIDDDCELLQVDGVSADDIVSLCVSDEVVGAVRVAPHGRFVIAAVVPIDAEFTIEAGSQKGREEA
ncbi:MAG: hypothetical protein U0R50_17645 [Gaiellales bacterium]